MGLRLHDDNNLGRAEGHLVEGSQGLQGAVPPQGRGGMVGNVGARGGPGCGGPAGGGLRSGGGSAGVPQGLGEDLPQVGLGLLQLSQRRVDFQGPG